MKSTNFLSFSDFYSSNAKIFFCMNTSVDKKNLSFRLYDHGFLLYVFFCEISHTMLLNVGIKHLKMLVDENIKICAYILRFGLGNPSL